MNGQLNNNCIGSLGCESLTNQFEDELMRLFDCALRQAEHLYEASASRRDFQAASGGRQDW